MGAGIDIRHCTGSAETCPAVQQIFEVDEFYQVVGELEHSGPAIRDALGRFVNTCVIGTCPGQNPDRTEQILREKRSEPNGE